MRLAHACQCKHCGRHQLIITGILSSETQLRGFANASGSLASETTDEVYTALTTDIKGIHWRRLRHYVPALDPVIALASAQLNLLMSKIDIHTQIWGGAGGRGPAPIVRRLLGEFTTCTCAHIDPTLYRPTLV